MLLSITNLFINFSCPRPSSAKENAECFCLECSKLKSQSKCLHPLVVTKTKQFSLLQGHSAESDCRSVPSKNATTTNNKKTKEKNKETDLSPASHVSLLNHQSQKVKCLKAKRRFGPKYPPEPKLKFLKR